MSDEKVDFTAINKIKVSIASLRVQLTKCDNVEEMEKIRKNIFELVNEILSIKMKKVKVILARKENLLQKMASLEASIDDTNRELNALTGSYRDDIIFYISGLENEINEKKWEMETPTID